jgi:hypothetical protein
VDGWPAKKKKKKKKRPQTKDRDSRSAHWHAPRPRVCAQLRSSPCLRDCKTGEGGGKQERKEKKITTPAQSNHPPRAKSKGAGTT